LVFFQIGSCFFAQGDLSHDPPYLSLPCWWMAGLNHHAQPEQNTFE
jgi:hypothetical protein